VDREEILEQLDSARADREESRRLRLQAREKLEEWIPIALENGMGATEIAERTGLSRQSIYGTKWERLAAANGGVMPRRERPEPPPGSCSPAELAASIWGPPAGDAQGPETRRVTKMARRLFPADAPGNGSEWHLTLEQQAILRQRFARRPRSRRAR
jgi:hypothetical protein